MTVHQHHGSRHCLHLEPTTDPGACRQPLWTMRRPRATLAAVWVVLALGACGGGSGSGGSTTAVGVDPSSLPGANADPQIAVEQFDEVKGDGAASPDRLPPRMPENSAVRFLNQATFGSTDEAVELVQGEWRRGWLRRQFDLPVGRTHWQRVLDDQAADAVEHPERAGNPPATVWDWSVWEAYLSAPDQLRKRMGYALSQIMVVSIDGLAGGATDRPRLAAGWLDVLERHAFGNFRELLEDVTSSPAMGYYLSYRGNRKADYPDNDPTKPPTRVPDENYAREVMQLFTIGLVMLEPDGTPKRDNAGRTIDTYDEDDVRGLARVFTGYDWQARSNPEWAHTPMRFIAERHSPEAKRFLGATIAAGTDGPTSLRIALDTLFRHPNTGPFIGKQLIQRLVTSNPSPAYVKRVADTFADNGKGVRGDMQAVIDAVLRDREAGSPRNITNPAPTWGKLREPVLRYTTFVRAFGGRYNAEIWHIGALTDPAEALGQSPLHAPSVFNFYRPGYVPPGTSIARAGLVAPEFQITTDTSLPGYVNFMQRQLVSPVGGLQFDFNAELALAADPTSLVARLDRRLTNGAMSSSTRDLIVATVTALPSATDADKLTRVRTAILMTVVAPEYIVQR
jgi:uncharacterized protein (DUF1800 family)